jgi:putative CocE/NonD family hydrolase
LSAHPARGREPDMAEAFGRRDGRRSRHPARAWLLVGLLGAAGIASALAYAWRDRIPMRWQLPLRAAIAGVAIDRDVRIAMPDGVHLAATLYRPRAAQARLATIYMRVPYGRDRYSESLWAAQYFFRHGYAVLVQDVRGTSDSEGEFLPWRGATADGVATLDWITRQPWSNGKVGTYGCSALGELQYALARAGHPAHAAMIASGAGGGIGSAQGSDEYFGLFEGGVFELASGYGWFSEYGAGRADAPLRRDADTASILRGLPVAGLVRRVRPGPNAYDDFVRTPLADPRWQQRDYVSAGDRLDVPTLAINTWGDQTLSGTLALAAQAREQQAPGEAARHHVILAPGDHCQEQDIGDTGTFGELPVANTQLPYDAWSLRWFDYWLRGRGPGLSDLPAYLYFVLGENRWLSADRWPPAAARVERWYLGGGGHANGANGDGLLSTRNAAVAAFDEYRYDPSDPVPSRGGPQCCTGNPSDHAGPADQHEVERRRDVLVYTSAPVARPLRIVGPLQASLVVSTSVADTDFIARLVDVRPDGRAISIQEGALRARYRNGFASPALMVPGQRYQLTVQMRSIAYLLPPGHRLRLDVTSSSFPRLERNLNTGGRNFDETVGVVARIRLHHGGDASSFLALPVLDAPAVQVR